MNDQRTDDELNRIIAEWAEAYLGHWKCSGCGEVVPSTDVTYEERHGIESCMAFVFWGDRPNYCRDLNACHEAEGKLDPDGCGFTSWTTYANTLCQIAGSHRACIHATARQRAEALVKVIEQQKGKK